MSGRAQRHLAQVFGDLPAALFRDIHDVRLGWNGVEIGRLQTERPFAMTMRRDFDAALVQAAVAAGALDHTGARVARLEPDAAALELQDGTRLCAPLLIGADGVNSMTARRVLGRGHDPARVGFALEVEAPADPADEVMEIDIGAAAWGYGWSFPKHGSITIGVGGVAGANPDMAAHLKAYLVAKGAPGGLKVKGHHLPFGDFPQPPGDGRVLLAGDAAGLVDPITGEGIAWAVRSGQLAAEAAVRALAADAPGAALRHYATSLAPVQHELRMARRLRALVYARPLQGRFARALARHPKVQARYMALLQGERDYADMGLGSVVRMLWRMTGARI